MYFVRRVGGLELVRIVFNSFILYSIDYSIDRLSSIKVFHVGLKKIFCEKNGWVRVGENYIQFFYLL